MKNKITLVAICAFMLLIFSNSSFAQSASTPSIMYIECSAITPEKYGALLTSLKNNPDFEVGEACVPAHVISIKLKTDGNVQAQFNGFKNQTANVQLGEMKLLADYNDEKFMERCSAARVGR
jgi:hypothetical protein